MRILFVGLISLFLTVSVALAHPPSDIKISYDPKTKTVNALLEHKVANPQNHYISKADIGLNGKEIKEIKFSRQDNTEAQSVTYALSEVKPGDIISVEGYCNISGKLTKEITVPADK